MKRTIIISLILIFLLITSLTLVACKGSEIEAKEQEFKINTKEEFLDIKNKLGYEYSKTTFILEDDLTFDVAEWEPIGLSLENAFTSKLVSNGKTITLNITEKFEPNNTVFGIFGYSLGAYFENFNINVNYNLNLEERFSYVGGLVGMSHQDKGFNNINVTATVNAVPNIETEYSHDTGIVEQVIDKSLYIGGIAGLITEVDKLTNITATCTFISQKEQSYVEEIEKTVTSNFNQIFAGGVAGIIRTVDISETNSARIEVKNISSKANFNFESNNVYAAAVSSSIFNADVENVNILEGNIRLSASKHSLLGGAFALADNSNLSNIASVTSLNLAPGSTYGKSTSANVGGIVGYLTNGSVLKDSSYTGSLYATVSRITESYGGGIAGIVNSSTIKGCTVSGGFVIDNKEEAMQFNNIITGSSILMVKNFGGVAGRVHANSLIENIDCDFIAYQGIVCQVTSTIKTYTVPNDGDKDKTVVELDLTPKIMDTVVYRQSNTGASFYTGDEEKYMANDYGFMQP